MAKGDTRLTKPFGFVYTEYYPFTVRLTFRFRFFF